MTRPRLLNPRTAAALTILLLAGCGPQAATPPAGEGAPAAAPTTVPDPAAATGGVAQDPDRASAPGPVRAGAFAVRLDEHPAPRFERVVLVTIDTLRADHLAPYGYFRSTAPWLERLAAEGTVFRRALAAVSHTAPSHATIFTGVPPALHGLVHNGQKLGERYETLAEVYRRAGFETAGVCSVQFLRSVGQGFDFLEEKAKSAEDVADAALRWLAEERGGARFFLWLHLYDPHGWAKLGKAPEEDLQAVRASHPDRGDALFERLAALHGLEDVRDGARLDLRLRDQHKTFQPETVEEYLAYVDHYDALIHFADRQLARVYAALDALELPGATLWVVTSDHGEGLGSHRISGHGTRVYNEQLFVPLVFHAPGGALAFGERTTQVDHLDLFPTLVEWAGGRVEGADPRVDGSSLEPFFAPLAAGAVPDAWTRRPAFSQRRGARRNETLPGLFALQSETHKYIRHEAGRDEFYELASDPLEAADRAGSDAPEEEALRRLLEARLALYAGGEESVPDLEEMPAEWVEELRALGYVE